MRGSVFGGCCLVAASRRVGARYGDGAVTSVGADGEGLLREGG